MNIGHDDLEQLCQKDGNQDLTEQIMAFVKNTCAKQNMNKTNMLIKERKEL